MTSYVSKESGHKNDHFLVMFVSPQLFDDIFMLEIVSTFIVLLFKYLGDTVLLYVLTTTTLLNILATSFRCRKKHKNKTFWKQEEPFPKFVYKSF